MTKEYNITFIPDNITVAVKEGNTFMQAARSAGLHPVSLCAGEGVCGKCKIILKKGALEYPGNKGILSDEEYNNGIRLACKARICSDAVVEIPQAFLQDFAADDFTDTSACEAPDAKDLLSSDKRFKIDPLVKKIYLEIPQPESQDKLSDFDRICLKLRDYLPKAEIGIPLQLTRDLAAFLRDSSWRITVSLSNLSEEREITALEKGNTAAVNYGLAIDIGTTTLNVQLIDLNSACVLGTKIAYNKQAVFGADVITRIIHARTPKGLLELNSVLTDELNSVVNGLLTEHKLKPDNVSAVVCAGNTTMTHLLLKIDPSYIRIKPYVPVINDTGLISARETGFDLGEGAGLFCAPSIASYVGGDISSGVLYCGLNRMDAPCLLVDIGTNGEVVLGNKEFLLSCAASAGPAFEGSGVTCGMRALKGAIERFCINDGSLEYKTIGGFKPAGICGSGYISLIGEMLNSGWIDRNGKFLNPPERLLRDTDTGKEIVLLTQENTSDKRAITVSESDIDNIKRAKAAIFASISALLGSVKFNFADLDKIFIAGGFGSFLDIDNAIRIGLIPYLPKEKFIFVGNSSLAGARLMLISKEARQEVKEISEKMTYFELSDDISYMHEYTAALFFPHTDISRFPANAAKPAHEGDEWGA